MRASVYTNYGPPEVVKWMEFPKPTPKGNELLIKVYAATVNRTDAGFRSAAYFISRFWTGLLRPRHPILGCEFSGIIEAAGPQVSRFKVGDRVFGFNDKTCGGHAEYLTIAETDALCLMPDSMNFEEAAAMTEGSHYAWVDIRAAKVSAGQSVLVYGAGGAIGSAAVQLLKYVGAKVTAVCHSKQVALIQGLGADRVIDYEKEDFTKTGNTYSFIFDAVGKSSFKQCKPLLTEKGIYISTELGRYGVNVFQALVTPFLGGKRVLFPIPTINSEDITFFRTCWEEGKFKPVLDRRYRLEQIVEAYHYVESGQKTGNVILQIGEVD